MSACGTVYKVGSGECKALLSDITGGVRFDKGVTFTDSTVLDLATWRTAISSKTEASQTAQVLPILNFEKTTDDPETLSSGIGKKRMGKKAYPSGIMYLDMSLCDYKHYHGAAGIQFDFAPTFQDGSFWMTRKADGTLKPFRCSMNTVADFPPDDKLNSFPMYLFFDSYQEFENVVLVRPTFQFDDLEEYSPAGLELRISTAYTGGVVRVVTTKRGTSEGMTGLTEVADWPVREISTGTTLPVAVTVVSEVGQGAYDLTIKKDTGGTPTNLSSADIVGLQAQEDDGTYLTYQSGLLSVIGGA